ncbi:MAG: hypothetical protein WCT77_10485, partial [Bacteroidota bacterium]
MKKIISIVIFLFAISTLHATEYKFFTAKQGLPKALEAAKALGKDSIKLYKVYCSELYVDYYLLNKPVETLSVNDTVGTA